MHANWLHGETTIGQRHFLLAIIFLFHDLSVAIAALKEHAERDSSPGFVKLHAYSWGNPGRDQTCMLAWYFYFVCFFICWHIQTAWNWKFDSQEAFLSHQKKYLKVAPRVSCYCLLQYWPTSQPNSMQTKKVVAKTYSACFTMLKCKSILCVFYAVHKRKRIWKFRTRP